MHIGHFAVSNALLTTVLCTATLAVGLPLIARKSALVPSGVYNGLEALVEFVLNFMDSFSGSRERSYKYFKITGSLFVFIFLSNIIGLLPVFGPLVVHEGEETFPLFRVPTSDLNLPLALAIMIFFASIYYSFKAGGVGGHFKRYFNKNPIMTFVGLIEFVGEIAKVISLSFRLFGNIIAGEVLFVVIVFLVQPLVPIPFLILALAVGAIQALVFSMISVLVIRLAEDGASGGH